MLKILFFIASLFVFVACSTPYQSSPLGWTYSEKVGENIYDVNTRVNGMTSESKARDYVKLKSAETTLENNSTHYRLIKGVVETGGPTPGVRIYSKIEIASPDKEQLKREDDWVEAQKVYNLLAPKYID